MTLPIPSISLNLAATIAEEMGLDAVSTRTGATAADLLQEGSTRSSSPSNTTPTATRNCRPSWIDAGSHPLRRPPDASLDD
jgi:hypothetical protein